MRRHVSNVIICTIALLAVAAIAAAVIGCDSSSGGGSGADFDATGEWEGNYSVPGRTSDYIFSAEIVQDGDRVTGTLSVSLVGMSGTEITGTVDGNTLSFSDVNKIISFKGTAADDDTAAGTYVLEYDGNTIKGDWSATCYRMPVLERTVTLPAGSEGSYPGIAWDGEAFWLANGQGLARVSTNGELLDSHMYNEMEFPYHSFDNLAWDGESLWATEDGFGDAWDQARLCSIDPATGEITASIPAPPDGSSSGIAGTLGIGLGWDGSSLWCYKYIDIYINTIYRIDRSDGSVLGSFPAPTDGDGMPIWANGFGAVGSTLCLSGGKLIYLIRASDGKIMKRIKYEPMGEGPYNVSPGGAAWDGELLWVRDTIAGKLFGFELP